MGVGIDPAPDLGDLARGGDEISVAGRKFVVAARGKGHAVGIDNLMVGIGEQLEGKRILGAESFVALDGIEGDAEDDGIERIVFGQIALEVVGLDGAAAGHVLGVEVKDDPLALELRERNRRVFLGRQAEVGSSSTGLKDVGGVNSDTETARGHDAKDNCDANSFANHGLLLVVQNGELWRTFGGPDHAFAYGYSTPSAIKRVSRRYLSGLCKDSDAGAVRCGDDSGGVEEQSPASLDGEAGGTGAGHGLNGGEANDGHIESHVLIWLGYLDDGEGAAEGGGGIVEAAHEGACAFDGGVGTLHGFDGNAGLGGDDDGLAEVEGGQAQGYGAPVGDVLALVFGGGALGEDAGLGEQRFKVLGGGDELDALVGEDLGDRAEQLVGSARAQVEKQLGETPVGTDAGEYLRVLDLAGHDGAGDAWLF